MAGYATRDLVFCRHHQPHDNQSEDLGVSRQAFDSYLLNRGVNKELASYIMRYAEEKEKKVQYLFFHCFFSIFIHCSLA
jgi:hypothetical protein